MTSGVSRWIYWLMVVTAVSWLHMLSHWRGFSLISLPLVLSLVMTFTVVRPWAWLLLLATIAELFTWLPPGVLATAIMMPWLVSLIPGRPPTSLSWSFFGLVVVIAACQSIWLVLAPWLWQHPAFQWNFVPQPLPWIIFSSAVVAMVAIIIWREWIEPLPLEKTIPRYNHLRP